MSKPALLHIANRIICFFARITMRNKLVFIVEDNNVYAASLKSFLALRFPSMKIRTFSIGEDCLAELYRNPTLVIMDHVLNTQQHEAATGLAIIKKIKHDSANTQIILLSAQNELNVFVEALALYDCMYFPKDEHAFRKVERYIQSIH